jgi:hypothetical protein
MQFFIPQVVKNIPSTVSTVKVRPCFMIDKATKTNFHLTKLQQSTIKAVSGTIIKLVSSVFTPPGVDVY